MRERGKFKKALVVGDTVGEIIEHCIPLLRSEGKETYEKAIALDLYSKGYSSAGRAAGEGTLYIMVMRSHYKALHRVGPFDLTRHKREPNSKAKHIIK